MHFSIQTSPNPAYYLIWVPYLNAISIVKEFLTCEDLKTTMTYTHVLNRKYKGAKNRDDDLQKRRLMQKQYNMPASDKKITVTLRIF